LTDGRTLTLLNLARLCFSCWGTETLTDGDILFSLEQPTCVSVAGVQRL